VLLVICTIIGLTSFSVGQDILSVIGYSQDVHYSKLYRASLLPTGVVVDMELLSFAPGCHDDCGYFSSVYDVAGKTTYFKITYGESPEIVNSFALVVHDSLAVSLPENYTAMAFTGNGTALYLQDNSDLDQNAYSIFMWNAYNDSSVPWVSRITTPYSFYRSCFAPATPSPSVTTLYALDRDKASLIAWTFTGVNSSVKAYPLDQNSQWVHSIESLAWSLVEGTLYALDRNGSVWGISLNGKTYVVVPAQYPTVRSHVASNQLAIHPTKGYIYYVGYDITLNSYMLVTAGRGGKDLNTIPLHNALLGLEWIGLTLFSSK